MFKLALPAIGALLSKIPVIPSFCSDKLRNDEYSILPVMSELSTVRCDRALSLWIAGTRASKCRRKAAVEVLWPMDRAMDGGEGQPGPELGLSVSCGVHSWIEGASDDGRRVS